MYNKIIFLVIFTSLNCLYTNQYLKDYNLHRNYRVRAGDEMIEYKYAKVRNLESGIAHVIKLKEKRRVVLVSVDEKSIELAYHKDFVDERFEGLVEKKRFVLNTTPVEIDFKGFRLKILKANKKELKYSIEQEPESIAEPSRYFSRFKEEGEDKPEKEVKEGLAY